MTDELSVSIPMAVEAEESLLSATLTFNGLMESVSFLKQSDFYIERNGLIWQTMLDMRDRGQTVDLVTVMTEVRDRKQLENIGGAGYLIKLTNSYGSALEENVIGYARLIADKAKRRRLINIALDMQKMALDVSVEVDVVYEKSEMILQDEMDLERDSEPQPMSILMDQHYADLERRSIDHDAGIMSGLTTGLIDLDNLLGGFQPGDLITLGARPGMGKTSFALTAALGISMKALKDGKRKNILIFSIEMSKEQIVNKLVSMVTDITTQAQRQGSMTDVEWSKYLDNFKALAEQSIFVDDTGNISIQNITRKSSRMARVYGLDLVIVDYLQLTESSEETESERLRVTLITKRSKQMARKLNVPVLLLAQLNRGVEQRADKRPGLSDLAESGGIEANSDIVMFLYRDDYYNANSERPNQADLIVAKYRNGATDTIPLYFKKTSTLFMNMSKKQADQPSPAYRGSSNGKGRYQVEEASDIPGF